MSKKIRIEVECTQRVTYRQEIEVTPEEFELLEQADGACVGAMSRGDDKKAYNVLDGHLNYGDVYEGDMELDIINIRKI